MPGNEQYPGAKRRPGSKKGPTKGSGGQRRKGLEGKGPTPRAENRVGHPKARAKARAEARAAQPTRAKQLEKIKRRFDVPEGHEILCGRNAVVEAAYGGADGAGSAGGGSQQEWGSRPRRGRAVRLAARAGRGRVLEGLMNVTDRAEVASLAAALTFLEGHAEVVLDDVHPNRMPSVHRLRAVLSRSRAADGGIGPGPGLGSLLLHRLMGLEAKEAQYADGAAFVRSVVTRIGHEGLNAVWADPELLPTPAELARPDVWVRRVS